MCQFVEWLDEPWPDCAQESFKEVWKQLKTTKRAEARATEALQDAFNLNDVATDARVALQEEVNCTKEVAQCFVQLITGRLPLLPSTRASSCS